MKIEYTGIADRRIITKDDFKSRDFDHETVDFDTNVDGRVIEVDDEVGEWLVKADPDFKEATKTGIEKSPRVRSFVTKTEPPKATDTNPKQEKQ